MNNEFEIEKVRITNDYVSVYYHLKNLKKQFSLLGIPNNLDDLKTLLAYMKGEINGFYGKSKDHTESYKKITVEYSFEDNIFKYKLYSVPD